MAKIRELVVIMVALAILLGALWFWLYLRPSLARMADLEVRIEERYNNLNTQRDEAQARRDRFAELSAQLAVRTVEWNEASADLPQTFRDTDVLRHVQQRIYPHANVIELEFYASERRPGDELYSTRVNLVFETSYWQLLSILYHLVEEEALGNRIVVYEIDIFPMEAADFLENVIGIAEYFPDHIREQFVPLFQAYLAGADVEFPGLYMLQVDMYVEYLSLEPGILSTANMEAMVEEVLAGFSPGN